MLQESKGQEDEEVQASGGGKILQPTKIRRACKNLAFNLLKSTSPV